MFSTAHCLPRASDTLDALGFRPEHPGLLPPPSPTPSAKGRERAVQDPGPFAHCKAGPSAALDQTPLYLQPALWEGHHGSFHPKNSGN